MTSTRSHIKQWLAKKRNAMRVARCTHDSLFDKQVTITCLGYTMDWGLRPTPLFHFVTTCKHCGAVNEGTGILPWKIARDLDGYSRDDDGKLRDPNGELVPLYDPDGFIAKLSGLFKSMHMHETDDPAIRQSIFKEVARAAR